MTVIEREKKWRDKKKDLYKKSVRQLIDYT